MGLQPYYTHNVPSSNGRTSDFDSEYVGSNPAGTTIALLAHSVRATDS